MNYALITGASSGMGLEYARQLAQAGYNIMVVSNDESANCRVVESLRREFGVEAVAIYCDLTQSDAAEQLYARASAIGRVDVLVSNAGMLLFSTLERTEPTKIEQIIALHCTTPTKLCRLFACDMRQRGEGVIILMSSVTAYMSYPTISHYAASKAYMRSLGESLWYELRGSGVKVCTVFPSAVDTPFYRLDDKMRQRLLRCGVMLSARTVVSKALRAAFAGCRRCLPGVLTKIVAAICWAAPAWVLLPILKIPAVRRILERV